MTSEIARLVIEIAANADKLRSDLSSAHGSITSFATTAVADLAKIGAAVGLAVAGAATIVGYEISKTADHIFELKENADKFHMPIEELQKFNYQASLVGLTGDDVSQTFKFMERNVAQAAQGTGTASKAFAALGIDAKFLKDLSPEEQFRQIGAAMGGISSNADRVDLAMQVFGRSGAQVLNLLKSNFSETSAEFKKMGIALSEPQAEAVSAFVKAEKQLGAIWEGFKEQVTAAVADTFGDLIKYVSTTIEKMGGIKTVAAEAGVFILDFMLTVAHGVGTVLGQIDAGVIILEKIYLKALQLNELTTIYHDELKPGIEKKEDIHTQVPMPGRPGMFIPGTVPGNPASDYAPGSGDARKAAALKQIEDTKKDILSRENNAALNAGKDWGGDFMKGFEDRLQAGSDKLKASIKNSITPGGGGYGSITSDTTGRSLSSGSLAAGSATSGYGTITSERTGQTISTGNVPGSGSPLGNQIPSSAATGSQQPPINILISGDVKEFLKVTIAGMVLDAQRAVQS